MSRPYPIIEYAHMIGKNTADFTVQDFIKFTKWWAGQEIREDLINMTPAQRIGYEKDLKAMKKFRDAQTSRLSAEKTYECVEEDREEAQVENEIIVEMGLARLDVEALKFALGQILTDYEMSEHEYGASLLSLKEALEGV